jgi:hypothetical protein
MGRLDTNGPRFVVRHVLVIALGVTLNATVGFAYTAEQRAACTPDVFRLCSSEIPDVGRIIACLKNQKPNLSADCRTVMNSPEIQAATTRSLATPEGEWCVFSNDVQNPIQDNWLKWCGNAARRQ